MLVKKMFWATPNQWIKIAEALEYVGIWLPISYKAFSTKFLVTGNPKFSFKMRKSLFGSSLFLKELKLPIFGNLKSPMKEIRDVVGSSTHRFSFRNILAGSKLEKLGKRIAIVGDKSFRQRLSIKAEGTFTKKLVQLSKVRGRKDFKKIIWEILQEEE